MISVPTDIIEFLNPNQRVFLINDVQNDSDFGLTGGIHTLDAREIEIWRDKVEVGNAYINRGITGAIVQRQPFGGWKNSVFGPGSKAGGPNYVSLFAEWKQESLPKNLSDVNPTVQSLLDTLVGQLSGEKETLEATAKSCAYAWEKEFSIEHDPSNLHGESNHFRYRAYPRVLVRADGMSAVELAQIILATVSCGSKLDISVEKASSLIKSLPYTVIEETEKELIDRLPEIGKQYGILRVLSPSEPLQRAANDAALQTITAKPLANGRLEMLNYLREQAISETTHRYGNVIPKAKDVLLSMNK